MKPLFKKIANEARFSKFDTLMFDSNLENFGLILIEEILNLYPDMKREKVIELINDKRHLFQLEELHKTLV